MDFLIISVGDYILHWDSLFLFISLIILIIFSVPIMLDKECPKSWFLTLSFGILFIFVAASRLFDLQNREHRLLPIIEKFCQQELGQRKELCSFSFRYDENLGSMIFLELKKNTYPNSDFILKNTKIHKRKSSENIEQIRIAVVSAPSKLFLDLDFDEVVQFKKMLISNKEEIKLLANEFFKE